MTLAKSLIIVDEEAATMKVTAKMKQRALAAADQALEGGSIEDCVRAGLEAALADVPEPPAMTDAEEHYRARINRAETRVSELTAMLDPALADLRRAEARIKGLDAQVTLLIAKESETFDRAHRAEARIAELEAKLAKVREYAVCFHHQNIVAILDEEQP